MTQCNTFIRKIGNYAVITTITAWDEVSVLDNISKSGDFMVPTMTTKNPKETPSLVLDLLASEDCLAKTKGNTIDGLLKMPIWGVKKL